MGRYGIGGVHFGDRKHLGNAVYRPSQEASMNFSTPFSAQDSNRCSVPMRFSSISRTCSCSEVVGLRLLARWITTSPDVSIPCRALLSPISAWITCLPWPDRLTLTVSTPSCRSLETTGVPMNPLPPVTTIRFNDPTSTANVTAISSPFFRSQRAPDRSRG